MSVHRHVYIVGFLSCKAIHRIEDFVLLFLFVPPDWIEQGHNFVQPCCCTVALAKSKFIQLLMCIRKKIPLKLHIHVLVASEIGRASCRERVSTVV